MSMKDGGLIKMICVAFAMAAVAFLVGGHTATGVALGVLAVVFLAVAVKRAKTAITDSGPSPRG